MCYDCKRSAIGILAGCLLSDAKAYRGKLTGDNEDGRATAERLGQLLDEIKPFFADDVAIRVRAAELIEPLTSKDLTLLRQLASWAGVALMDLAGPIVDELNGRADRGDEIAREAIRNHEADSMIVGRAVVARQLSRAPGQLPMKHAGIPS